MAVIVLTPSKKTMKKSHSFGIGYITREDKAYKTLFLDCTEKNYDKDFQEQFNCRNTKRKDCRTFYHIKQSFDVSDKVDKDIAFEIAKEISFHYLDKGYQVVCATHTDTDHLHNHIIFSSVDCAGNMFKDTKADLKELTNLHDKIMQRYGFKTQEDLKKEKIISRKENLHENKLKEKGLFTNKELITYAIDKVAENKDVKNIYDFVKELNKRYKIHCYFRGSFINFEIDGKKYRGVNLGNSYSLASIKRKVSGKYNEKDIIENLVKDLQKTVNSKEEFLRELKENRVTFEETTGDIIFKLNGKETSLKNFSIYNKDQFYREILLNKLKADLKLDIYKIKENNKIVSLEKWIEEIKKLNYIDDVKLQSHTVLILSGNLKLDIKKLGYGSDEKNRFSLENIKKNLFIKRLGEELKHQVRNEKFSSEKDILNFLSQKNISFSGQGKNLYIRYENQDINLKRFIVLDRELRKIKISKFFIAFRKTKNLNEFENISEIKKINDSYFYHDIDLSTIKFDGQHLNYDGIMNVLEQNLYHDMVNKSYSYEKFIREYHEKNLKVQFNENEIRNRIEENKLRKEFFKIINHSSILSVADIQTNIDTSHKKFFYQDNNYYYTNKDTSSSFRIKDEFLNKKLKENVVKTLFFSILKKSTSYESFCDEIQNLGHKLTINDNDIVIDEINLTKQKIINKFGRNLATVESIKERCFENYDYINQDTKSLKYQFKEKYFKVLQESHSIFEFQEKLSMDKEFDFKFEDDTIFFRKKGSEDFTNTKEYNFYDSNFFSTSSANEFINKKNQMEEKNMANDFIFSLMQLVQSSENRKQNHRSSGTDARHLKYLRLHREFEEYTQKI